MDEKGFLLCITHPFSSRWNNNNDVGNDCIHIHNFFSCCHCELPVCHCEAGSNLYVRSADCFGRASLAMTYSSTMTITRTNPSRPTSTLPRKGLLNLKRYWNGRCLKLDKARATCYNSRVNCKPAKVRVLSLLESTASIVIGAPISPMPESLPGSVSS